MRSAKSILTLCAAAAFVATAAIASPAVATNNSNGRVVVQQAYLERNGWYCMQSSETPYYYVCTKVFGPTFECHFGICSETVIRPARDRLSTAPNGAATRADR